MISSQRASDQPSPLHIEELIRLFDIYIDGPEGCRQRSYQLLERYPKNLTVIEIAAACDSLTGKYNQAIAGYQKCLEIDPKTLAYTNNQAWNLIQLKDYEIAMTLLSDIKDKWNHPAIYSNWATILQNLDVNHGALEETLRKRDKFLKDYPQYKREGNNELIHTFLLKPEENYTRETEEFKLQIFQLVEALRRIQKAPLNIQTLKERLQSMQDKIIIRKQQGEKSGIVIDPLLKIALDGLKLLQTKILNNYNQKYSDQLQNYVFKSIEIISNQLFCQKIDSKFDFKTFEENKLVPTIFQITEIGEYMQEKLQQLNPQIVKIQKVQQPKPISILTQVKVQKHQQVQKPKLIATQTQVNIQKGKKISKKEQNSNNHLVDCFHPNEENVDYIQISSKSNEIEQPQNYPPQHPFQNSDKKQKSEEELRLEAGYHFYVRLEEVEQIQKYYSQNLIQKLRIQKENQTNPLFVILHFRIQMNDSYIIFINIRRINQQIIYLPHLANLQSLTTEFEREQVKRYYLILSNMMRFYNFYGTHNFVYQRKNIKSHLDTYDYLQLIAPVLNHIFIEEDISLNYKVGEICKTIHSIIANYITETKKKGDFLRSFNKIFKRLHSVIESSQNPVQNLLQSLLGTKQTLQYTGAFLNNQLLSIDGSTKYHEYFIKRMNNDNQAKKDENWLIFNISILLLSTLEDSQSDQSLELRFRYCYYSSRVTEAGRSLILRKFYTSNHPMPLFQRVGMGFKNIVTKILP